MKILPYIKTPRLLLCMPGSEAARERLDFTIRNRHFFSRWQPPEPEGILTLSYWEKALFAFQLEYQKGISMRLCLFTKDEPQKMIGTVNYTMFHRGPFQCCTLGYSLDEQYNGKGLMTEALRSSIAFIFEELDFHRIQANYMPINEKSARILQKLGFIIEGRAKNYVFINGKWEDHILTSLTHPSMPCPIHI